MAENNNLELWNRVEKTDPKNTKDVRLGARKFKSVDPYSRFKVATKEFGSFGDGWGIRDENYDCSTLSGLCIYTAWLFYYNEDGKEGGFPIKSSIVTHQSKQIWEAGKATGKYNSIPDEDFVKKVSTDALTKGLSMLGVSADIFMGKFEDEKYVSQMRLLASIVSDDRLSEIQAIANACKDMKDVGLKFKLLPSNEQVNSEVLEVFASIRERFESK